jgi:uncharacterized protein (DUF1778 family)
MPTASNRLELRIQPQLKQRIEQAASLTGQSASDFVRAAAEHRAEQVLREHDPTTVVPADFFDRMLTALEGTATPNPALTRAAASLAQTTERR